MADVRSITDPVINKISIGEYNAKVAAGTITDTMIADQVWIDTALTVPVQNKLVGIEANAQVNKIESVKVNGTALTITNKEVNVTVPTKTSEIANDSGFITASDIPDVTETDPTVPAWAKAASKPSYTYDEITGKPTLSTVATSGSYDDLADKPTLFSGSYNDLTNKPTLFSGSYNDLTDKPTIPSVAGLASETYVNQKVADLVNSAPTTLDTLGEVATAIQNNATVVEALNNSIGNKANATDVTALSSRVTTAEGNITSLQSNKANSADLATVATSGSYNDLTNKPTLFSGSYNDLTNKPTLSTCTLKIWG